MHYVFRSILLSVLIISVVATMAVTPTTSAAQHPRSSSAVVGSSSGSAWVLSTSQFSNYLENSPYVGNGYIGEPIPAAGMGSLADLGPTGWPIFTPRLDTTMVSGLYAQVNGKQVIADIPTWSTLTFTTPGGTYSPATAAANNVTGYQQSLNLREGVVTTSGTWTDPSGARTQFTYQVFTDRAREHIGVVALSLTPAWSGKVSITGLLDGSAARRTVAAGATVSTTSHTASVTVSTTGLGIKASEAVKLTFSHAVRPSGDAAVILSQPQTAGEQVSFPVSAGTMYTFTKYVGVATADDTGNPTQVAASEAAHAAALSSSRLLSESAAAWANIWTSDITVAGNSAI